MHSVHNAVCIDAIAGNSSITRHHYLVLGDNGLQHPHSVAQALTKHSHAPGMLASPLLDLLQSMHRLLHAHALGKVELLDHACRTLLLHEHVECARRVQPRKHAKELRNVLLLPVPGSLFLQALRVVRLVILRLHVVQKAVHCAAQGLGNHTLQHPVLWGGLVAPPLAVPMLHDLPVDWERLIRRHQQVEHVQVGAQHEATHSILQLLFQVQGLYATWVQRACGGSSR